MSTEKHTPGKWKIIHEFNVVAGDPEVCVANCGGWDHHGRNINPDKIRAEKVANAELCASAPRIKEEHGKMVKILKIIKKSIEMNSSLDDNIDTLIAEVEAE